MHQFHNHTCTSLLDISVFLCGIMCFRLSDRKRPRLHDGVLVLARRVSPVLRGFGGSATRYSPFLPAPRPEPRPVHVAQTAVSLVRPLLCTAACAAACAPCTDRGLARGSNQCVYWFVPRPGSRCMHRDLDRGLTFFSPVSSSKRPCFN